MNKIAIPALLVATIMVAGAFAFMPVEQATTVHTTSSMVLITTTDTATIPDAGTGADTNVDITCTDDVIFHSIEVSLPVTEAADEYAIRTNTLLIDARAIGNTAVDPAANNALDDELIEGTGQFGAADTISLFQGDVFRIVIDEEDADNGADGTLTTKMLIEAPLGTSCTS